MTAPHEKTPATRPDATGAMEQRRMDCNTRSARVKQRMQFFAEQFGAIDLDAGGRSDPEMFVKNAVASGSPGVIAAHEKSHKSSVALDLAVCLAAPGRHHLLGHPSFEKQEGDYCEPTTYISYEGTAWETRDKVSRIEEFHGTQASREHLMVFSDFPPLSEPGALKELESILELQGGGLLFVDPLYLALRGVDFTRKEDVGAVLMDVQAVCNASYATPIYCHHFNQSKATGLGALSGAGLQQHVGQWIFLNKQGPYDHDAGRQRYRMDIGSRAGFGGRYTLKVTEGHLSDPGGRHWHPSVSTATSPTVEKGASTSKLSATIMEIITRSPGVTQSGLRAQVKRSARDIKSAVSALVSDGMIEAVDVVHRGNQTAGYRTPDAGRTGDESGDASNVRTGGCEEAQKPGVSGRG